MNKYTHQELLHIVITIMNMLDPKCLKETTPEELGTFVEELTEVLNGEN